MVYENSKQVVIIKNIKSNVIEEAIFILKNDFDSSKAKNRRLKDKYDTASSDHILQEAQGIIDNYIKKHALSYGSITSVSKIRNIRKWNLSVGTILNGALIISIIAFIFLLSRAFK